MYQNFPNYYPYMNQPQSQPAQCLKGRPVVSFEEARAAQIDLDGSIFIFTDIANKKIYTKQINMDGTAVMHTYILTDIEQPKPQDFITRNEFNQALIKLENSLKPTQIKF